MRRFSAVLAGGLLFLGGCGGAVPPASSAMASASAAAQPAASASVQPRSSVRVAYVGPFDNMAVMWVAKETGLFEKHGLDVDLKLIQGSPIASAALVSRDVDLVEMSGPAVVNSVSQGADSVMIAGFENVFIFTLMVDPAIKSISDLKGKTAAVTLVGAEDDAVLRKVLRDNKLEPDVDVNITPVRDPGGQLATFNSKQAQAVMTAGANIANLKKLGAVPLVDVGKLKIPFQSAGLVTTRAYLSGHRSEALGALKASVDAIRRIKADKPGTQAIMGKYMKTEDKDVLDASWEADNKFMEDFPTPTLEGFQEIINERKVTGHKPEDFVDLSLIKELEQAGFFKR